MRSRTVPVLAAMVGMLLYAGAFVRHHGVVLGTHLLEQMLGTDLAFCHGDSDANSLAPSGHSGVPQPSDAQSGCPVCAGLAPALALTTPDELKAPIRFAMMARWLEPERINPALRHAVCPPSRGPPAFGMLA